MGMRLELVSTTKRAEWSALRWDLSQVMYMGDRIFDHYVFRKVAYSSAPANADPLAKKHAHFVTGRSGGDRAVAEACRHILERFSNSVTQWEYPHTDCHPAEYGANNRGLRCNILQAIDVLYPFVK